MSIRNIINEIENTDLEQAGDRRGLLKSFGAKVAIAALPLAIGSMFKKARAADNTVANALNELLVYKYMEFDFYTSASALLPSLVFPADQGAVAAITVQENAHITVIKNALTSIGGASALKPEFDFTANGTFSDVFTNTTTFMAVAQMIEDAGVRTIKGQLAALGGNKDILGTILRMHSTEARHAAHVRLMRRLTFGNKSAKPWITTNQTANIDTAAVKLAYVGEDNVAQGNFNMTSISVDGAYITIDVATEAFDEPMDKNQADAIISLFTA